MTRSEAIEAACRTLAQHDGHNPDAAVARGETVIVAGVQVTLIAGPPQPIWELYQDHVESAIKVLGAVIAEPAA